MKTAAGVLVLMLALLATGTWWVSRPLFDEQLDAVPPEAFTIMPTSVALTFARTTSGDLLLVTDADAVGVHAVNLSDGLPGSFSDPVTALAELGLDTIRSEAARETDSVPFDDLVLPFDPGYPHIAAGTNFRAHAEEVGLDDGPFLFPKLSAATPWNADVPTRTRLDYEAEVCAVTLATFTRDQPARLGYVICNDFTDRWTLIADIDLDTPMGRTGFPDAKGGPGMLPIGPFLVVPQDDRAFHDDLEMGLYLNGVLRQRAPAGLMIWSPHDIAEQALADCDTDFQSTTGIVPLTRCDGIPPGTLLLTGTPAGVAFHYLNIWSPASYLEPGDEVITYANGLGMLRNRVR